MQDEIQSHHWIKENCKLHPLVVYNLGPDGSLQRDSLRFISDGGNHDTSFLCQVQTMLLDYLKVNHPHRKKLIEFSDGCGGQNKTYKIFMDLCSQKNDFGISAEMVFFTTCYCKSPCDGIGGAVKRLAAKRTLQRTLNNQKILSKHLSEIWSGCFNC